VLFNPGYNEVFSSKPWKKRHRFVVSFSRKSQQKMHCTL